MKKKFLIGGAALLFAAVTALNMNLLQSNKAGDVSLENMISTANANPEVSNDCLHCGGDGVSPGGSSCPFCGGGDRDRNNSNWGGLFHYPDKGGNPKECTLYIMVDAGGQIISQSTNKITANIGYTVRKTKGMKETCPFDTGTGCTVYSCQLTN
jgi:hypothetical protein